MLRVSTNEVFVEELSDQGGWVCVQNIKLEQCHSFALSQKVIWETAEYHVVASGSISRYWRACLFSLCLYLIYFSLF